MTPHPDETQQLITRLAQLEAKLEAVSRTARLRRRITLGALGVLAFAATIGSALAANGNCPNGLPFCFTANQPAIAAQVNHDFAQVKEWIETKAGPVTSAGFSTGSGTFSAGITAASLSTSGAATVAGLLSSTGGLSVSGGTLNANSGLTVNGATIFSGYETACYIGAGGFSYPGCCRIDVRTGQTSCRVAGNWPMSSFTFTATDPFAASTPDHYSLTCLPGVSNQNFPTCCRTNSAGTVTCRAALDWTLTNWATPTTAF
jgi:hypothetical protein